MLSDLSIGLLRNIALLKTTLQTLHSLVKSQHMLVEHFGIFEGLVALGTLEGLVAIVEDVVVEVLGTGEHLLTLVTHEVVLLAVYLHMDIESIGVGEDLVADMTGLQTLACVDPHVIFQLLFLAEDNVAHRTGLSLLSCVSSLMGVARTLKHKIFDHECGKKIFDMHTHVTLSLNIMSQN